MATKKSSDTANIKAMFSKLSKNATAATGTSGDCHLLAAYATANALVLEAIDDRDHRVQSEKEHSRAARKVISRTAKLVELHNRFLLVAISNLNYEKFKKAKTAAAYTKLKAAEAKEFEATLAEYGIGDKKVPPGF